MGHFFLARGDEIALVVVGYLFEERGVVDDVGVGSDGEGFGDLGGYEDGAIAFVQVVVLVFEVEGFCLKLGLGGGDAAESCCEGCAF